MQYLKAVASFLDTKINLIAIAFCGLSLGFWMIAAAYGYYYFLNGGHDMTFFAQIIWGLNHGNFSPSIHGGCNFIVDHCVFWSFLIAPIYWVFPTPLTLLYLKAGSFFIGAYVFFLILKKNFPSWIAFGGMVAFTLAPANIGMLNFTFNHEPFAIPMFFLIFKFFEDKKLAPYLICCFLLAMIEEQMPLVVFMFGVFALFFRKEGKIKWGIIPILMGLTIFIIEIFVITPYFRKGLPLALSEHWIRYIQFGKTPSEILLFVATHPVQIFSKIFSQENITWFNGLFGVWGSLAFLSPHVLLVAAPLFLKTLLSSDVQERTMTAYYAATFTPFIFLATFNTLKHFNDKWRRRSCVLVIILMLIHSLSYLSYWSGIFKVSAGPDVLTRIRFIDKIPQDASVLSSWKTLANLANRSKLYMAKDYLTGEFFVSRMKFNLPQDTDFLLLDFNDEWIVDLDRQVFIPRLKSLLLDDHWSLLESIDDIALFEKTPRGKKAEHLIETDYHPLLNQPEIMLNNDIALEKIDFPKEFPSKNRIFPVIFSWRCINKTIQPCIVLFQIKLKGQVLYTSFRVIGSTIYPTDFWVKNQSIKERYFYLLPYRFSSGDYLIEVSLYDSLSNRWTGVVGKESK